MKIVAKKDRKLLLINTGNTQNENKAETIELTVPEEYEDYNKKIVFVTDNGIVWDIIQDNTYKLTKAITKYKQVDFYIWLTKDDVDFRSKTMPLRFYHNEDASDEITDEEIHGVNTVVNILEEEITKVDSLETELRALITDIQNKLDNGEFDGEDGYTPQKGIDYFTEQDIEEIETDVKNDLEENVLVNYSLIAETGAKIELSINTTDYKLKAILKDKNNNIIHTSNVIDLPLETMVVNATYDNVNKAIILTLQNGTTVEFSVADLVAGLQTEITSQNKLASDLVDDTNSGNKFVTTSEKQTWNNKLDESDLTDYVKNTDYASPSKGGVIKTSSIYKTSQYNGMLYADEISYADYENNVNRNFFIGKGTLENVIAGKQLINQTQLKESQATQDEQIERLKATLPTITGEGQDVTLDKTAELEFIKPPLPMGNSEQESTEGKNLLPPNNELSERTNNGVTFTPVFDNNGSLKYINLNGTASGSAQYAMFGDWNQTEISITVNQSIKLSINDVATSGVEIQLYKDGTTYIASTPSLRTIEINENTTITEALIVIASGTVLNNLKIYPMITFASETDDTYEPYTNGASPNPDYPQEITNVTGDVEVKVQNKNWFNKNNVIDGYRLGSDGTNFAHPGYSVTDFIKVKPSTNFYRNRTITIMEAVCLYDKDKNFISRLQNGNAFTTTKNTYYIKTDVENTYLNTTQLELGSTASPYTSHKEQVLPLTLGNIELCKIGDYQDYFYKESNKWYLHEEIKKILLDGTEYWSISNNVFYLTSISDYINSSGKICLSDKYTAINNTNAGTSAITQNNSICFFNTNTNPRLYIRDERFNNVNDFETELSENNVKVYYPTVTPTDTEITDTTLISQLEAINNALSYEEQTNISSNTIALFNVEAYQSTKLVLEESNAKYESLEARVALLE